MEYVALAVATADDVVKEEEEVITVLLLALLLMELVLLAVDEDVDVCDVVLDIVPTPTQYAYPGQKFVVQSFDTSGFHLMKSV